MLPSHVRAALGVIEMRTFAPNPPPLRINQLAGTESWLPEDLRGRSPSANNSTVPSVNSFASGQISMILSVDLVKLLAMRRSDSANRNVNNSHSSSITNSMGNARCCSTGILSFAEAFRLLLSTSNRISVSAIFSAGFSASNRLMSSIVGSDFSMLSTSVLVFEVSASCSPTDNSSIP